jgi:hypothetical protein
MNATIDRIKLIFLGLFVLACGAIFAYHALFVWPKERCEAHGDWWDDQDRVCAVPMPIWTFTHRMPGAAKPAAVKVAGSKPIAPKAVAKAAAKP